MYHEFTPCAALVPFIDKFWVFKGFTDIGTRFKILADGCTDFIFSIGNMTVPTDEHSMIMQPYRSYFVGPMRVYSDLTATTNTLHMLGVRFHPCGLAAFTNEPLGQFADLRIPLIKSNLFKRNQEGPYNKMSKQKREAIASLFCLIQEHPIYLAYNPFTARYE
mgnify:CR=1 FL=1